MKMAQRPTIHTTSQGLRVILQEAHVAPIVTIQAFVGVGSADEDKHTIGAAHFFEHLIFKGTKKRGVGQIASDVEAAGGHINAYTSFDQTVFYLTVERSQSQRGLEILSDALINHSIPEEELEREREVVIEEIRRSRDLPQQVAARLIFETAYSKHPYGRPILGFEKTLKAMSLKNIRAFYQKYYTSRNITLIAVGDFETETFLPKIKKYFHFKNSTKPSRPRRPLEPRPSSPRFKSQCMDLQETYVYMGFPGVAVTHPDCPGLDVLSHLLGSDETSLLYKSCILDSRVANSVVAQCYTPRDPGLFLIGTTCPHERTEENLKRIATTLGEVTQVPVSDDLLQRIKDHFLAERLYDQESVEGIARDLGHYFLQFGTLDAQKAYYDAIESLTPEHLTELAKKYFLPKVTSGVCVAPETSSFQSIKSTLQKSLTSSLDSRKVSPKKSTRSSEIAPPHIEEVHHRHGKALLVMQRLGHLPLTSLRWVKLGGVRLEPAHQNGISQLFSTVWPKGSRSYSPQEILERMKSYGGAIHAFSGRNTLGVGFDVPTRFIHDTFHIFDDICSRPLFDPGEFNREKGLQLEEIRTAEDHIAYVANRAFLETLYPHHPYGRPLIGHEKTVTPLRDEHMTMYHRNFFSSDQSVVSIVGDFDPKYVRERVRVLLDQLQGHSPAGQHLKEDKPGKSRKTTIVERKNISQAHILLGFLGTTLSHPNRFAYKMLSASLSGQGGRLFLDLRDRQSLAYTVAASDTEGIERGYFSIYIACAPDKIGPAIRSIREHLDRLRETPLSTGELARAKAYLLGQRASEFQHHSTRSLSYALDTIYGVKLDETLHLERYLEGVTPEDIQNLVRTHMAPEQEVLSVVCPPEFRDQIT